MLVDLRKAETRTDAVRAETAAAIASAKLAKQTHDEKIKLLDLGPERRATRRASRRGGGRCRAERDAALKALQAERGPEASPQRPRPQDESAGRRKCPARRAGHCRQLVPRTVGTRRRARRCRRAPGALDAEAGRAAVAATEAARRCAEVERSRIGPRRGSPATGAKVAIRSRKTAP